MLTEGTGDISPLIPVREARSTKPWIMERLLAPLSICTILALITFAIFAQTFSFEFLKFDDNVFISENPQLKQGLSAKGLAWALTANLSHFEVNAEYWEPLTLASRLMDVQLSGLDAGAHHRTNVILHLVAGLVLFGTLRQLLRCDLRSGVIAALFLIHPLHVEPVAWLSARKDVLNGLFFFATIWVYALYASRPSRLRLASVCFVFLLANMAKPMAVSLPIVLLLLDFWPLKRLKWPVVDRAAFVRLLIEKIPLILIAVVISLLAVIDQRRHGAMGDDTLYPPTVRLGSAAIGYCTYLGQTFVPANLAILYPHPGVELSWLLAAASAACLVLISGFCILSANRRPWLFVGWGWFVIVLLPVSGVVQIGEMARADRYTYVSLVGIFLLCTEQVSEWLTAPTGNRQYRAVSVASATVVILGIFMLVSRDYTKKWHDDIPIFRHALAVTSDNYIAEANLGSSLYSAGLKEEGMAHYRESIRIHAPALEHHRRTALEAERRHDLPTAIHHYGKVLTLVPWDAEIHQHLGAVLLQNGDYAKALVQYNEALRYDRGADSSPGLA